MEVDKQIIAIERNEAALRAIETVEAAGGTVYYHSINLLNGESVAAVMRTFRYQRYGRIDVILHAGGLLIDRPLPDEEPPVCPGLRCQGGRVLQPAQGRDRDAESARRWSSVRWQVVSATPRRATTVRPTTCCVRSAA